MFKNFQLNEKLPDAFILRNIVFETLCLKYYNFPTCLKKKKTKQNKTKKKQMKMK